MKAFRLSPVGTQCLILTNKWFIMPMFFEPQSESSVRDNHRSRSLPCRTICEHGAPAGTFVARNFSSSVLYRTDAGICTTNSSSITNGKFSAIIGFAVCLAWEAGQLIAHVPSCNCHLKATWTDPKAAFMWLWEGLVRDFHPITMLEQQIKYSPRGNQCHRSSLQTMFRWRFEWLSWSDASGVDGYSHADGCVTK